MFKVLRNGLLRYILHTCPKLWCNPCSMCYGMDCFGTYFTHVQSCDVTRVQSATEWTASVHFTHVQSCDVTRVQSATEWTASVHTSRVSKSCDVTCVHSARSGLLRYTLRTCPKLWCNPCSKWYGMDFFGAYLTHVQSCDVSHVQIKCYAVDCLCLGTYFTHVQCCDVTRVQSATQWTASVHTSLMSRAVM